VCSVAALSLVANHSLHAASGKGEWAKSAPRMGGVECFRLAASQRKRDALRGKTLRMRENDKTEFVPVMQIVYYDIDIRDPAYVVIFLFKIRFLFNKNYKYYSS